MPAVAVLAAVELAAVLAVRSRHQRVAQRRQATGKPASSPPSPEPEPSTPTPSQTPAGTSSTRPPPGTVAPFARPTPPLQPTPPEKPDFVSEADAVRLGTKAVTGIMAWTPLVPVAPLFKALGGAIAEWSTERERAEKAQPYLRALRYYALAYAPYLATMERWPKVDALYNAGDWDGCKRAEDAARAAGAKALQDVRAQIDAMELAAWRAFFKDPKNKPGLFSSWNSVTGDAWLLGTGGFTGLPRRYAEPIDVETNGEWLYNSLVDGVTRMYSPTSPDAEGVVRPRLDMSPAAIERMRQAWLARAAAPVIAEQTGQAAGQAVRDVKDAHRNGTVDERDWLEPEPAPPVVKATASTPAPTPQTTTSTPAPTTPAPAPAPAPPAPAPLPAPKPPPPPPHPLDDGPSNKKGGSEIFTQSAGEELAAF